MALTLVDSGTDSFTASGEQTIFTGVPTANQVYVLVASFSQLSTAEQVTVRAKIEPEGVGLRKVWEVSLTKDTDPDVLQTPPMVAIFSSIGGSPEIRFTLEPSGWGGSRYVAWYVFKQA